MSSSSLLKVANYFVNKYQTKLAAGKRHKIVVPGKNLLLQLNEKVQRECENLGMDKEMIEKLVEDVDYRFDNAHNPIFVAAVESIGKDSSGLGIKELPEGENRYSFVGHERGYDEYSYTPVFPNQEGTGHVKDWTTII